MFNPEDPFEKKKEKRFVPILAKQEAVEQKKVIEQKDLMPERDAFRHYCMASIIFREKHGVRVREGKAEIIDTVALGNCEEWQREILREVCLKLIREYKEASKFWEEK